MCGIGGGGIESDEYNLVAGAPRACEAIAESSASGQQGSTRDTAAAECLPTAASPGWRQFGRCWYLMFAHKDSGSSVKQEAVTEWTLQRG